MRTFLLTCFFCLTVHTSGAKAAQLQDSNFALTFRVAKDEFDRSCKLKPSYEKVDQWLVTLR